MNIRKLRGKIAENGISVDKLAEKTEINRSTLYRKLSSRGASFTVEEAGMIKNALGLTSEEASAIFFE